MCSDSCCASDQLLYSSSCRTLCNWQLSAPICLVVPHLPPSSNHFSFSPTIIIPRQSSPFLVQLRWLTYSTSFPSCRQIQRISVGWTKWQNHRGRLPLVRREPAGESKLVLTSCVLTFWENQREHKWFDVNSINVFYPRHVLEMFSMLQTHTRKSFFFPISCMKTGTKASLTATSCLVRTVQWWCGMTVATGVMCRATTTCPIPARRVSVSSRLECTLTDVFLNHPQWRESKRRRSFSIFLPSYSILWWAP